MVLLEMHSASLCPASEERRSKAKPASRSPTTTSAACPGHAGAATSAAGAAHVLGDRGWPHQTPTRARPRSHPSWADSGWQAGGAAPHCTMAGRGERGGAEALARLKQFDYKAVRGRRGPAGALPLHHSPQRHRQRAASHQHAAQCGHMGMLGSQRPARPTSRRPRSGRRPAASFHRQRRRTVAVKAPPTEQQRAAALAPPSRPAAAAASTPPPPASPPSPAELKPRAYRRAAHQRWP